MTNKEKYQDFCKKEKEIPVFSRPWYLDTVCLKGVEQWDVALVEKGDQVVASMPYVWQKRGFFKISAMPFITKFLGPYLKSDFRHTNQSRKIIPALIEQIPNFDFFVHSCFYTLQDWLPFHWNGFEQTTHYSYEIDLSDLDQAFQNISSKYRNNKINKAKQLVQVTREGTIDDCYELLVKSFKRQGLNYPFGLEYLKRYDEVMKAHQVRHIFFAKDEQGQAHSVLYLLVDHDRAYCHLVGDDPDLRSSGAGILLIWEAMRFTKQELGLNIFDFEGSMIEAIERVRRDFGAVQTPYFTVSRYGSKLYKVIRAIRS